MSYSVADGYCPEFLQTDGNPRQNLFTLLPRQGAIYRYLPTNKSTSLTLR